jgi:uncharacterized lipoprotein YmbA
MRVRKLVILIAAFAMTACSSAPSSKSYYQLPTAAGVMTQKSNIPAERQIQLTGVNVADYLNGLGIVYQTSDVQFVMANNNLWAGSLQQQLQQSLMDNLNADLPGWIVTNHSTGDGEKTLSVNVAAFHGRYDGTVVVRGDWILTDRTNTLTRSFDILLSQTDDGYDSLVRALAKAWRQQNEQMAQTIAGVN